jgi:putative toxin-antitoxin system antitoxin component (TIGR02293 family)
MAGRRSIRELVEVGPIERVQLVKDGVPAKFLVYVVERMGVPKERIYATIGVSRATVDRKVRAKKVLSPDESERALGIARLVAQVESIVRESGRPEGFDAARWLADWLEEPNPALGGKEPAKLMDTADGRAIVSDLLARAQSGAYA